MEYVLKTNALTKKFGNTVAVNNVNMSIEKGEIYGFIGKNGAGKTTAMKMILGTIFPTSGSLELFDGQPLDQARRKIGSLIENPGIFSNCSAKENLIRFSLLFGGEEKIDELLYLVGLQNAGKKKVSGFSLGMKQRLGIAVALMGDPEFLVLDEPINGLDPEGIKGLRDLILNLNKERGITFLISSHILDELSKVVTKYGIIANGILTDEIKATDLLKQCTSRIELIVSDPFTAVNILRGFVPESAILVKDNKIVVTEGSERSGEINTALVSGGVIVNYFNIRTSNIEDFIIKRLG